MKDEQALQLLESTRALSTAKVKKYLEKVTLQEGYKNSDVKKWMTTLKGIPSTLKESKEEIEIIFDRVETICNDSETLQEKGSNSAQTNTYENLKEQRQDVIYALSIMSELESDVATAMEIMKQGDNLVNKAPELRESVVQTSVKVVNDSLLPNSADKKAIYISATKSERKAKKIQSNVFLCLAIAIAALMLYGFIWLTEFDFWTIFVCPVAMIVCFVFFVKKKKMADVNSVLNMSDDALNYYFQNNRYMQKELFRIIREAQEQLRQSNLSKRFKTALDKILQETMAAEANWPKIRQLFEEKQESYLRRYMQVWGDFRFSIPDEFCDFKNFIKLSELIQQKRADSLKEAYPILEMRQREERRDLENQAFQAHQREIALQQAAAQERAAEYAHQQAKLQEQATEYARQQAKSQEQATEYARQQAKSQEQATEYARRMAENQKK